MHNLEEAYQFVIKIGSQKIADFQVGGQLGLYLRNVLSIVPEASTLPHGRFSIDAHDSSNEFVIEVDRSDSDAQFRCALDVTSQVR
jgi:hypothetical protein